MKHTIVLWIAFCLAACETQKAPLGVPRCEPEGELLVERQLKSGFKHLFEGNSQKAKELFQQLLDTEPGHPEALLGVKHAEGVAMKRSGHYADSRVVIARRRIPVPFQTNTERLRYEFDWEGYTVRSRVSKPSDAIVRSKAYSTRDRDQKAPGGLQDVSSLQRLIDTIVFRDSETTTASDFFHLSVVEERSTHFLIASDGAIFQTLDLVHEAHHCASDDVSQRSISITIVNPLDRDKVPTSTSRPASAVLERHGVKVSHWGYNHAQEQSLKQLVAGLFALFPKVKVQIPEDRLGRVLTSTMPNPDEANGLIGHYHIDEQARDPTVGFPWIDLRHYLSSTLDR